MHVWVGCAISSITELCICWCAVDKHSSSRQLGLTVCIGLACLPDPGLACLPRPQLLSSAQNQSYYYYGQLQDVIV
jgi:hypothetical protein